MQGTSLFGSSSTSAGFDAGLVFNVAPRLNTFSKNSIIALVARLATVATTLTVSAFAARSFTGEEFGLWAIFQSVLLIGQNMDLGLRYGMGNRLAALTALPEGERAGQIREVYLAVFNTLAVFGMITALVVGLVAGFLPWSEWLNIHQPDLALSAPRLMAQVGVLLLLSLPGALAATVYFANQEIAAAGWVSVFNALLLLAGLVISTRLLAFDDVVLVYFASNLGYSLLVTFVLWRRKRWSWAWLGVRRQWSLISGFLTPSLRFFGLTLASILTGVVGTLVAGTVFGLVVAGHFSLMQRFFSFLHTIHMAVLSPMAPEYTRLAGGGHWDRLREAHLRMLRYLWPAVFVLLAGGIWMLHPWLLRMWTGLDIADYKLAGILWLWTAMQGWTNTYSVVLNSLGLVGFQGVIALLMIVPSVLLPYYLSQQFGQSGVAWGLVLCQLPVILIWPRMTRTALTRQLCKV